MGRFNLIVLFLIYFIIFLFTSFSFLEIKDNKFNNIIIFILYNFVLFNIFEYKLKIFKNLIINIPSVEALYITSQTGSGAKQIIGDLWKS